MIDNISITFIETLKSNISQESNIYIQCNQTTFLAIAEFIDEIEHFKQINVLVGDEQETLLTFGKIENDFQLRSDMQSILKAKKILAYTEDKIQIKKGNFGSNIVLIENNQEIKAFIYTNHILNGQVLGLTPAEFPMITTELQQEQAKTYLSLFHSTFSNAQTITSIKDLISLNLDLSFPKTQYLYGLGQLFDDYERIENYENLERTGFFNSKIWSLLYNFQKDAVLGAIDKIEKYGGCIIADSVGLGKTFEALGVIKYYQNRNKEILVLSPKRLYENWNVYRNNDRRNILAEDRLNYDLLFHTDLSRYKGKSNGIDLENFYWENVDLIVIDESHNFRNNSPSNNRITRYERLMQDIIKKGVKTKVLMLSATPVNNRLKDLKNQLYFITEEDDQAFNHVGISSINQVLRKTQQEFNKWLDKPQRTREELINDLDGRYFKLLDMLTIARSRKHIQKYYDTVAIGQFPNRLTPINLHADFDTEDKFPDIGYINNEILRLNMAQYNPTKYIMPNKRALYSQKYDHKLEGGSVFRQEAREESLIGLMRVNYLKRLESSIYSFRTTMARVQENIKQLIQQIDNYHQNGSCIGNDLSILDDFDVDTIDPEQFIGDNVKVLLQDMDLIQFKQDLQDDLRVVESILNPAIEIDTNRDEKLQALKKQIRKKVDEPINKDNKKVLIFSAFADTATYLYKHIAEWAKEELGLYSGLVTGGSSENRTNLPNCTNEFNNIIINFSPKSKNRPLEDNQVNKEIDILIATDVISEGQNLQDCDYLINYDIHWNPVRIVQRFGRIDRIGSTNAEIQLVNFWPNVNLNAYIDLVERVKGRMTILDVSATGDEDVINTDAVNGELSYRIQQMQKLQNQVLDLEDLQGDSISIADFTFNDFKVDLDHLTPTDKGLLKKIIPGFVGVAKNNNISESGIIFCLKHLSENENYIANNPLYPYCLIFVSFENEIIYNVKQCKNTLDVLRSSCMIECDDEQTLRDDFVRQLSQKKTQEEIQQLWQTAISSIKGNADLSVVGSIFKPGETITPLSAPTQEFALVNYFVINK